MKRIRPKGALYRDLDADDIFIIPGLIMLVIAVLVIFFSLVWAADAYSSNKKIPERNERVASFNSLPLKERQLIAEWTENEDIDSETYLMNEYHHESPFILRAMHGDDYVKAIPFYILALAAIFSVCTFGSYWYHKNNVYYLCALPYHKPYGWLLFFCIFMGWPFMLGSFICMRVQCSSYFQEQRRKRQQARERKRQANAKEKQAVQKLAEQELTEIARSLTEPKFPERAHRTFVNYIMNGQPDAYKSRLSEARRGIIAAEDELQKSGEHVRTAQRQLGEARAKLAKVEETQAMQMGRAKAEADWEAIKNARGVSKIVFNRKRRRLEITIKVRVPYRGELYDFGDYCLYIDGSNNCRCKEVRSGLKLNHTSTEPQYHIRGNHFCFGSSLSTIENYLAAGRYAEAITLVVECLHSVNDKYAAEQIPNCFRKVSAVEKAKRRTLRRNKLKFWQRK